MEETPAGTLVSASLAGDGEAFTCLYRRFAPLVRTIMRDFATGPDELADLVQEVFTRAYASLPKLRDPDRFEPWLHSIARHVGRDALGTRRSAHRPASLEEEPAGSDPGPEDLATFVELSELVDDVIIELGPRDAMAVSLARLGLGPKEIGSALGISYGAAKVALHRARTRLRTAVIVRLLLRDERLGCETFGRLRDGSSEGSLTRHVAGCDGCAEALIAVSDRIHPHRDRRPAGRSASARR